MMKVEGKTKDLLVEELEALRQRVAELEIREEKHKQAEKALQESKERYRVLFNSGNDAILVHRLTTDGTVGKFIEVNDVVCQRLGYSREELLMLSVADIITPETLKDAPTTVAKLLADKHVLFEAVHLAKDGTRIPVEISTRLFDLNGQPTVFSVARDITERKQAEEVLRQSEGKYRSLVNNVKLGIFRSTPGPTGRFLEVNPSTEEITGYSREELLQMNVSDLYVQPEEREEVLKEAVSIEGKITRELYFRKKDGTIIAVSDTKVAVRDSEGRILFFDGILEDITKRKREEEELRGSRKELRDLSTHLQSAREEERKRIALEIHDEMGQELTALKMDLSWLAKRFPKGQELLLDKTKLMLKRVDMTMEIVKRISAELRPALLDDFGLAAAIEWYAEEFQELAGIRCELVLNLREIMLDGDSSTAIFRIFQEILTNVARHAEATKVTVDLKESANKLVLKVSDNGRGITEKEIFRPKSLGLIGMRERALVLGGKIEILGVQGKGTTITASIPLKREKLNAENPRC